MLQPHSRLACSHPLQKMLAAVKASPLCTECPFLVQASAIKGLHFGQSVQGLLLPK